LTAACDLTPVRRPRGKQKTFTGKVWDWASA